MLATAAPLGAGEEITHLTMLWSAKEAIRKMVEVTPLMGFMELELVNIVDPQEGREELALDFRCLRDNVFGCQPPLLLRVMAMLHDDFALAVTISQS